MSDNRAIGQFGPKTEDISIEFGKKAGLTALKLAKRLNYYALDSGKSADELALLQKKIDEGKSAYILGFNPAFHNTNVALIKVTKKNGIELICNEEEERYSGKKHDHRYPKNSLESVISRIETLKQNGEEVNIDAIATGWDYIGATAFAAKSASEHYPESRQTIIPNRAPEANIRRIFQGFTSLGRARRKLHLGNNFPIIASSHHDNHAAASYALSPFNAQDNVIVTVIDGYGDDGSITVFNSNKSNRLEKVYENKSLFDSLGVMYSVLSSGIGGWKRLSSEGRLMGLAAYGNNNRKTTGPEKDQQENLYYKQLKEAVLIKKSADDKGNGIIQINRNLINVCREGVLKPWSESLIDILGEPISERQLRNPDDKSDERQKIINSPKKPDFQDYADKAAAVQMLFEDAIEHIVEYQIRKTGSNKLVMTGGTALNCVASMRLLQKFDKAWYQDNGFGDEGLHLWIPPFPSDSGAAAGAAYNLAMKLNLDTLGEPLQHAFYVGQKPKSEDILDAIKPNKWWKAIRHSRNYGYIDLSADENIGKMDVDENGYFIKNEKLEKIADFLAFLVSKGQIVGLYQGEGETGPRALGHRSILLDPRNKDARNIINERIKNRAIYRPAAPFGTLESIQEYFEIPKGLSDPNDQYNALRYMVVAAKAKNEEKAIRDIPGVIHKDGTGRIQVVDPNTDPFTHEYLKAFGRYTDGIEISINTSLNVNSPIVQTPEQALHVLRDAPGMLGLLMIGDDGHAYMAYHNESGTQKNGRTDNSEKINRLYMEWSAHLPNN
ncbi:MAG: carbamoyltransferase [Nanoarchaeota archaeon]|nr:carbamoyltransferase [Nanoarchaeota archaeon]